MGPKKSKRYCYEHGSIGADAQYERALMKRFGFMAQLHCSRWTLVQTQIRIPNPMATLYYTENVHIVQPQTRIPTPYFCIGQAFGSESVPKSVSGNVNESLQAIVPESAS